MPEHDSKVTPATQKTNPLLNPLGESEFYGSGGHISYAGGQGNKAEFIQYGDSTVSKKNEETTLIDGIDPNHQEDAANSGGLISQTGGLLTTHQREPQTLVETQDEVPTLSSFIGKVFTRFKDTDQKEAARIYLEKLFSNETQNGQKIAHILNDISSKFTIGFAEVFQGGGGIRWRRDEQGEIRSSKKQILNSGNVGNDPARFNILPGLAILEEKAGFQTGDIDYKKVKLCIADFSEGAPTDQKQYIVLALVGNFTNETTGKDRPGRGLYFISLPQESRDAMNQLVNFIQSDATIEQKEACLFLLISLTQPALLPYPQQPDRHTPKVWREALGSTYPDASNIEVFDARKRNP